MDITTSDQLKRDALNFFQNVDADALREDLLEIFVQYVTFQHDKLPADFENMGGRFTLLMDFLKNIDRIKKGQAG